MRPETAVLAPKLQSLQQCSLRCRRPVLACCGLGRGLFGALVVSAVLSHPVFGPRRPSHGSPTCASTRNHNRTSRTCPDEVVNFAPIRRHAQPVLHDTGLKKQTLAEDAQSISVMWGVVLTVQRSMVLSPDPARPEPIEPPRVPNRPVFLSRTTPDNKRQEYFLDARPA